MILSFKTQINGKPTFFVEKIWQGFPEADNHIEDWFTMGKIYEGYDFHPDAFGMFPKRHTIRKDKEDHWETGTLIDFVTDEDTKGFRFAPQIPVVSTQSIGIYHLENSIEVCVDGTYLFTIEIEELAINDGFESVADFFAYFNETYHGKIIHWTDLRY